MGVSFHPANLRLFPHSRNSPPHFSSPVPLTTQFATKKSAHAHKNYLLFPYIQYILTEYDSFNHETAIFEYFDLCFCTAPDACWVQARQYRCCPRSGSRARVQERHLLLAHRAPARQHRACIPRRTQCGACLCALLRHCGRQLSCGHGCRGPQRYTASEGFSPSRGNNPDSLHHRRRPQKDEGR